MNKSKAEVVPTIATTDELGLSKEYDGEFIRHDLNLRQASFTGLDTSGAVANLRATRH